MTKPFLTGWCSGPNHHMCARFYTGRNEKEYMCECPCHKKRKVKKVPRRKPSLDTPSNVL